jgi:Holliday junction resolvasome RuvABC endonuclease subunit
VLQTIIGIDSGAINCGLAVIQYEKEPFLLHSETCGVQRGDLAYQEYKLEVIKYFTKKAHMFWETYRPTIIVSETVPARGFTDFSQSRMADAAAISLMAIFSLYDVPLEQISARTAKKLLTRDVSASKVRVRNKVLEIFPQLKRLGDEIKSRPFFDRSDAIGLALAYLIKTEGI